MPRFGRAVWLYPVAFALHVLEEAPGFTAWARRHASERYSERDFARNNALGLLMTLAGTALVARRPSRPVVFGYFAVVLTQQVPFNAAFHAGTTIAYRDYSPGTVTALAQLPLWRFLVRSARRERLLSRPAEVAAAGIGGAIHAAAVTQQVYHRGPGRPGV